MSSKKASILSFRPTILINGVQIDVEMNEFEGDNLLSSINYGSGNAFYGTISQVRVYNIID